MGSLLGAKSLPVTPQPGVSSIKSMSYNLFQSRTKYQASQVGAYSFFNIESSNGTDSVNSLNYKMKGNYSVEYFVHANYTAKHAGPLYQAMLVDR